jgi:phosphoglycolate phosphatase-like HAD superfamily hydrolase
MPRHLLLFDIDGTLLKTGGAGMRAMARVAERLFGSQHKWDGIVASGNLDPVIFAEFVRLNQIADNPVHHQNFHDHYIEQLARELEDAKHAIEIMPGVHETFELLRRRAAERGDVVLGLLTGNYTKAVPIKLAAIGVDPAWFEVTAFGDEGKTRPDLVAVALRKYEKLHGEPADPRKVVVIGDTPRDVHCAHAHGCVALAVATGGYGMDELRTTGAEVVVKDLSDPTPLLRLIGE